MAKKKTNNRKWSGNMTINRRKKKERFVWISQTPVEDASLSLKAKGLLLYLFGRPEGWRVGMSDMVNFCKDGITSVRSALKELEDAGYVNRKKVTVSNRVFDYHYTIDDKPMH